ncbi:hypothetical protein evm_012515 [Chilo suppressalis]|nr:hypothetical protein evm_012515 [Chilo suppressalis]
MKVCKSFCPALPVVRKCCFCVPVRKGVTIFGYVNLVLSLLSFPLLLFLLVEQVTNGRPNDDGESRGIHPLVHLPITIACVLVDVAMNIVLLIGTHKKKQILLKVYLYFGVVFQLLTLCLDLFYFDYREYIENTVYFIFLCLNVYLLFLVYSVIHLIEESSEVQYIAYQHGNQLSP